MSSLVIVKGLKKVTGEQKRSLARSVGVSFIELEHAEHCKSERRLHNFQTVTVEMFEVNGGRKQVAAMYAKDRQGNDMKDGALIFYPDEFERGIAHMIDTPLNRRILASLISCGNPCFRILDAKIAAEIEQQAEAIRKDPATLARRRDIAERKAAEKARHIEEAKKWKPKGAVAMEEMVAKMSELVVALARNQIREADVPAAVTKAVEDSQPRSRPRFEKLPPERTNKE